MLDKVIPGAVAVLAAALLAFWLIGSSRAQGYPPRLPGADRPPTTDGGPPAVDLQGTFVKGPGVPSDLPGDWPWFRGPNRDNICPDPTPLAREFAKDGPPLLWSVDLGFGYAGPVVHAGRVYVLDYDVEKQADALRCLSLTDGKELWRRSYPVAIKFNHGMSRSVPAVNDQFVVSIGPKCHVLCVDARTGDYRWGLDMVRELKAEVPQWYAAQCPLLEGDRVILAPGGDQVLMMAVEAATGKVLWKTPNPNDWKMTHVSIAPMTSAGKRTYIYCGSNTKTGNGGVIAVSAEDGHVVWETEAWNVKVAAATPLPIGEDRLFLTAGYGVGSLMLKLAPDGDRIVPTPLFKLDPTQFGSEQHTPIFHEGYIYGMIPNGQMVCMDPNGKRAWASGAAKRFGSGPWLIAGGILYVVNDAGVLTLMEASPAGYKELGQYKILSGHDSWGPLALVGGRLLARDLSRMVCVDVSKH